MKRNKAIAWFDLETTGLDFDTDRIVSLAIVKTTQNGEYIDGIETKINPCGVKSSPEALSKHGITDEELLTAPKFSDIAKIVFDYMRDCDLGGHNIILFDIPFLQREFQRCGIAFTVEKRRLVDTRKLYWEYNRRELHTMYVQYCGETDAKHHDAKNDVEMSIGLYNAIRKKHEVTESDVDRICENRKRIDMQGFFVLDENMNVRLGRGKYSGMDVKEVDPGYFSWLAKNGSVTLETRELAGRCYNYVLKLSEKNK